MDTGAQIGKGIQPAATVLELNQKKKPKFSENVRQQKRMQFLLHKKT